ncbi:MAG: Cysteine--tRNA ligase [Firmicutes bacterium ADurb.Bin080]|jgi:cysteinyl-tRNA synthetase|nr:cysteine--tRNA ligase [Clostridiales bacterium]OQC14884.1 MAG: Cysteine--tRNA ligase [Firmicutes bacterium ADurb.Bin080]
MLKFYNTLTRKKEEFSPLDGNTVRMYSCGPTVYSYAHIGNLRTYIFMDLIRRAIKFDGYKLIGVMNITDVGHLLADSDDGEDKMVKASREQKKTPLEIADFYSKIFFEDIEKLNIGRPEIIAKATDHIGEMISLVKDLQDAGIAYETSDGIYFDISKFPRYGCLSGKNRDEQVAGARVEVNTEKHNPDDFAVWKKADPAHIMQWESPWGMGYPGWHIECSAMSRKYLGDFFDIHSGGVDHIPIHHENEIAQNEALTGKQSVRFWMHGEFMQVDGGKMSKSLGNIYTVSDLEKRGYEPLDFRFFCLGAHYRKKLNFTFEGMDAAKTARERLNQTLLQHKLSSTTTTTDTLDKYRKKFKSAVEDDINAPKALGILFDLIKEEKSIDIYKLSLEFDSILGLSLDKLKEEKTEELHIPKEIIDLANSRLDAKKQRNFALADELRGKINSLGYSIADTKEGYNITKN